MSKRLILILVLAFVVGITAAAFAEVQNVKVSGDLTVYAVDKNQFGLENSYHGGTLRNKSFLASVARIKVDADLTDNVMATVRLLNERYWGSETENVSTTTNDANSNISLDLAYATLKEFLYSPLTLTVGRQELHFGNDMIIGDAYTNQLTSTASPFYGRDNTLSARKSFDAMKATLNYDPLVLDIVGAKITESVLNNNDDKDLYGVNAAYKLDKNTTVEGYYWVKNTQKKAFTTSGIGHSKGDMVNVIGAHIGNVNNSNEKVSLTSSLEAAYQFGKYNDGSNDAISSRRAYAGEAAVTAGFKKVKYTPAVTLLAAYFSGKKDPSATVEKDKNYKGWDPMFENQTFGDIANQLVTQTNARLIGVIGTMKPMEDVIIKGEYYAFWFDQKYPAGTTILNTSYNMANKRFAGQELDLTATYNYTEDVQFALLGGMFLPGSAFAKGTSASPSSGNHNVATEVVGSMKVIF